MLPNNDELDFEFKDKTLNSTIKMLKHPKKDEYMVFSIVRFTEEAIEKFSQHNISVIDQNKLI